MKTFTATAASASRYVLAEGPYWDAARERLLWVDIPNGLVLEGHLDGIAVVETSRHHGDETVGAVVCDAAGELLVVGGKKLIAGAVERTLVHEGDGRRLNDGSVDPSGRFVVGSIFKESPVHEERLMYADGAVIDDDLVLSNGVAWSPDGALFYSVDSIPAAVFVRAYGTDGVAGPRRIFLIVEGGSPDGMCVDADGNLWIAIWGAGEVRCYSATDATVLAVVTVPVAHPTAVAFAGADLDLLVITTSTDDPAEEVLVGHPDAGRLFTVDVGVRGLAVPYWDSTRFPLTKE